MKSPESAMQKPARVTPEQRRTVLDSEDEISGVRERPARTAEDDRRAAAEATQKYLQYSQLHLDEAAMLSSELVKFQQNGLATTQGIEQYRKRLQDIHDYLQTLGQYADNFSARQTDQLKYAAGRNAEMVKRIEATLAQSHKMEEESDNVPFSARHMPRPSPAPAAPEPASPWTKKAPAQQPKQPEAKKGFWSKLNPRNWF